MSNAEKVLKIGVAVAVFAAALWIAWGLGYWKGYKAVPQPVKPQADTLEHKGTSAYIPPKEPQPKVIIKKIPVPVFLPDSTKIDSLLSECARLEKRGDSLQLVLIRAQRHYSDSTFDAWVSGIDPKLDSIKTYQTTRIITIREPVTELKKTRWGFGVQAGVGVSKGGLTPYVGGGVSYNILSW